jgi:GH18 family chitinase
MVLLMRDLHKELVALNPDYEVSAAIRADVNWIEERMPVTLLEPWMDQFNDMTYDYNAAYNQFSALNSPLNGCYNPDFYDGLNDQDCVTTEWGALDDNGRFVDGAWSECMGLCDGDNWGQSSSQGYRM